MANDKTIEELERMVGDIKTEIAQNEGAVNNIMERLKRELGVADEEAAYKLLKKMDIEIKVLTEQRDDLLKIAREKLDKYQRS